MLLCDMNPNLRFAQNIVFVPVGRQVCPGDNRIFYVTSGVGTLAVHGSSYPLAPAKIVEAFADIMFAFRGSSECPVQRNPYPIFLFRLLLQFYCIYKY